MNPHFASLLLGLQDAPVASTASGPNPLHVLTHPDVAAFFSTAPDQYRVLGWIVLMPLLGAIVNGLFGRYLSRDAVYIAGVGSVATSFVLALFAFSTLVRAHGAMHGAEGAEGAEAIARISYDAGQWFAAPIGPQATSLLHFRYVLDALSGVMLLVVTGVGTLIHVYSTGYMSHDKGYAKFFAFLNLFMFSMLNLILADNIVLLFVGWEGVGLCSYLLIGFWYTNSQYASAGRKAFVVNRIGDVGVILGMTIIAWKCGAYSFSDLRGALAAPGGGTSVALTALSTPTEMNDFVSSFFALPNTMALHDFVFAHIPTFTWGGLACVLLFIGCTGKSAQLPLYVWLPDAMAGPTPVSALIHAATMVTAGVYLLCRLSFLYVHFPSVLAIVAIIGALTALFAATIAVAQVELKKVLAYSTVSQLGFMFLGCGVGAFSAGLFHVYTHAMFKACLFLSAGAVMHACRDKQDIRELGGLRKHMPYTFWAFLLATLAIIGTPGFSGFFSKDEILFRAFALGANHTLDARITAVAPLAVTALVLFAAIGNAWTVMGVWIALSIIGVVFGAAGLPIVGAVFQVLALIAFVGNLVLGFVRLGWQKAVGGLVAIVVTVILAKVFTGVSVGKLSFALGVIAATLTAFYMCRLLFLTFWGDFKGWSLVPGQEAPAVVGGGDTPLAREAELSNVDGEDDHGHDDHGHDDHDDHGHGHDDHGHAHGNPWDPPKDNPWNMTGVLLVLGGLSVVAGWIGLPYSWTHSEGLLGRWLEGPVNDWHIDHQAALGQEWTAMVFGVAAFAIGTGLAYWMYVMQKSAPAKALAASARPLYLLVYDKWRIDELYGLAIVAVVRGFSDIAALFDRYVVDGIVNVVGWIPRLIGLALRRVQTGRVHTYSALLAAGAVVLLGWAMLRPAATIAYRADGNRVTVQAYGGPGYSYQWDLEGDGTYAEPTDQTQQTTTCTPSEDAEGHRVCHVGLRVRNAFGRTAQVTRTIVISGGEEVR